MNSHGKRDVGNRVLDEASRNRRQRKQLDALDQDNFQEDPHLNLTWNKNAPKFNDSDSSPSKKKRKLRGDHFKQRFKKTFGALLEEAQEDMQNDKCSYFSVEAPPSKLPPRHFCAVCGYVASYVCVQCGTRTCSVKCLGMHHDTRCLKWTA